MSTVEDPGWRPAAKGIFFAFAPMLGPRMAQRSTNGLLLMRQAWVSFTSAACIIWVPVLWLWLAGDLTSGFDSRVAAAGVGVLGALPQLVALLALASPVAREEKAARAEAQSTFLLRVALAEIAAVIGFIGFTLSLNPAVYLVGFVIALVGLLAAAPTAANIERMQQRLREAGSDVDLLSALVSGGITR